MTLITFEDGKVVFRDGAVGTEQACCCDDECVCPGDCVEGLQVSLGNSPTCAGGFYSDSVDCTFGQIQATMYCSDAVWFISVAVCCFENGGTCFASYSAELQSEADCLPPAGAVTLTEEDLFEQNGGCPPLPPVVTIIK